MKLLGINQFPTTPEAIYGVVLGFIILSFMLYHLAIHTFSFLSTSPFLSSRVRPFLLGHIIYARSHWRFLGLGPTSRAHLILTALYVAGTITCNVLQVQSSQDAGKRAATLSLINLIPMFLGGGYEFGARLLGVSLYSYGFLHRSFALVALIEAVIHIIIVARTRSVTWTNETNFYGILVCFSNIRKACADIEVYHRLPVYSWL